MCHEAFRRIPLLFSSTGQCSELSISADRVLAGLLAYQVVVSRVQYSMSTRLLFTKYKTPRKSRRLAINWSILLKQDKAYLPCFRGYLLGIKKEDKPCTVWEELTILLLHRVLKSVDNNPCTSHS